MPEAIITAEVKNPGTVACQVRDVLLHWQAGDERIEVSGVVVAPGTSASVRLRTTRSSGLLPARLEAECQ